MQAPRSAVFCWDGGLSFLRHEGEGVGNTAQYPLIVFYELRWAEGKHRHSHAVVVQHCKSPPLDSPLTASVHAHPLMHTMIDTLKSRRRISHAPPSDSRPIKAYMMMHFKGLLKVFVISLDEKITIEYSVGRGVAV